MSTRNITWTEVENLVNRIYTQVKGNKYDRILGVSRGGLIPATMLSHKLGIDIALVIAKSYSYVGGEEEREKQDRVAITQPLYLLRPTDHYTKEEIEAGIKPVVRQIKKVLIVDEILDSGETLRQLIAMCNNRGWDYDVAMLITKPSNMITVCKYKGEHINDKEVWVKFPWELENA